MWPRWMETALVILLFTACLILWLQVHFLKCVIAVLLRNRKDSCQVLLVFRLSALKEIAPSLLRHTAA